MEPKQTLRSYVLTIHNRMFLMFTSWILPQFLFSILSTIDWGSALLEHYIVCKCIIRIARKLSTHSHCCALFCPVCHGLVLDAWFWFKISSQSKDCCIFYVLINSCTTIWNHFANASILTAEKTITTMII